MIAAILLNGQYKAQDLQYPLSRLKQEGCAVITLGPELKTYYSQEKQPAEPDMTISDIDPEKFDLLIIPGKSKLDSEAIKLIQEFSKQNNLVAIIGSSLEILKNSNIDPKNIIFVENSEDLPKFMTSVIESFRKKK